MSSYNKRTRSKYIYLGTFNKYYTPGKEYLLRVDESPNKIIICKSACGGAVRTYKSLAQFTLDFRFVELVWVHQTH